MDKCNQERNLMFVVFYEVINIRQEERTNFQPYTWNKYFTITVMGSILMFFKRITAVKSFVMINFEYKAATTY
jgi:hypothetical protein